METPAVEKKVEEPTPTLAQPQQQEPVIPETVVSESADEAETSPTVDAPKLDAIGERQDEDEAQAEPDKEEGDAPLEPEGRNEEAAEESPDNKMDAPDTREGSEHPIEMTMEDPPTETPGLLCGCI